MTFTVSDSKLRARTLRFAAPALFAGAFLGVWYFFHYEILSERRRVILPPIHQIWANSFWGWDNEVRDRLWEAFWTTTRLSMIGLFFAIIFGVALAVIMTISKSAERSLYPWAVVLQTLPILALIPLIDVWFQNIDPWYFGFDVHFKKRLIVCVLIAIFPIITNTFFGLKSAERNLHDMMTLHRSNRFVRTWKLEFPASLPAMFIGFRIAAGLSVIGAIVAEFLFARGGRGVGNLIRLYSDWARYDDMIATILVSSFLGITVFWIFGFLGWLATRHWHVSAAAA